MLLRLGTPTVLEGSQGPNEACHFLMLQLGLYTTMQLSWGKI